MRRRLLVVILGTVFSALTIAAVGTFIGIKRNDLARTKRNLVDTAQRLAAGSEAKNLSGLAGVRQGLGLETIAVLWFPDPATDTIAPTSRTGLTSAETAIDPLGQDLQVGGIPLVVTDRILPRDLATIASGGTVTGIAGNRVYVAARASRRGRRVDALLLTTELASNAGQAVTVILGAAVASMALAAVVAVAAARRLSRPLVAATAAYRRIASGDLTVRVADRNRVRRRNDEIGQLTRALDTMAESLDRAQKQEQQFLLSVSHDLRTPLTSIRGFAEALADGAAPDPQRAAQVIAAEARRLERLVRDLLELAKLDARRFSLHPRDVDLTDLVTDAADGFLPAAEREGLTLQLDATDGVRATVDPERLAQVLANLIENALKFASRVVRVRLTASATNIEISIIDDGPGIDPVDLPHVFERLYTSDRQPTRQIGSGIGLAIVKELVGAMGGTVTPTTSAMGSTFTVRLPPTVQATQH